MVIEKMILGALGTNCYVVYDEESREAFVVDPASSFERIKNKIDSLSLKLKYIILTHAHFDHVEALDELYEHYDAKLCIGKNEENALSDSTLNLCAYAGGTSPKAKADMLLMDGDELSLGNSCVTIAETPGHTPGCISILVEDSVISGDTLFFESVGRTDFPGGNMRELIDSIKEKLFTLPGNTKVYPGHGEATTIEHEIKNNPFIR